MAGHTVERVDPQGADVGVQGLELAQELLTSKNTQSTLALKYGQVVNHARALVKKELHFITPKLLSWAQGVRRARPKPGPPLVDIARLLHPAGEGPLWSPKARPKSSFNHGLTRRF